LYTFELGSKGAAMDILRHAGIFALLALAIDLIPVAMAVVYVVRPTERNLALMRPFSLAGLFAGLSGAVLGFLHVLRGIGVTREFNQAYYAVMATGAAEALVSTFVAFGCLSVAWLLVAIGMSRSG
jgi:MotA/TolQ/ExbB proton channel family